MDGQVLGGGVMVLVAVVLWLVYLLPSLHGRNQFNAAERNAVRLSQALRVLAETSETPEEVRVELNARAAHAQQKLAKQAQHAREEAMLVASRAERDTALAESRAAAEAARAQAAAAREQAHADAASAREAAAVQAAAARALPAARRARARKQTRQVALVLSVLGFGAAAWGAVVAASALLWVGVAAFVGGVIVLWRMSVVQRRAGAAAVVPSVAAERVATALQEFEVAGATASWTPRELPRPLSSSAGSRASAVLDEAAARQALRDAAVAEAMRARAERLRPPSIDVARAARTAASTQAVSAQSADADIEAHVRDLLARRAAGM